MLELFIGLAIAYHLHAKHHRGPKKPPFQPPALALQSIAVLSLVGLWFLYAMMLQAYIFSDAIKSLAGMALLAFSFFLLSRITSRARP
jgi:hypothetical protein